MSSFHAQQSNSQELSPNYTVNIETDDGSQQFRYYIPPISAMTAVKLRVESEKIANQTTGMTTSAAYNWEMVGEVFKKVVNMDGLSLYEVADKFNLSNDDQQQMIAEAVKVASGGKVEEN